MNNQENLNELELSSELGQELSDAELAAIAGGEGQGQRVNPFSLKNHDSPKESTKYNQDIGNDNFEIVKHGNNKITITGKTTKQIKLGKQ